MELNPQDLKQAGEVVQSFVSMNQAIIKFTQQNASSIGLTVQQMAILNLIRAKPEITLKAIAERLSLPKSTVSVNIDGLVNLELIERKQSQEDRREVNVKVTIKGKELSQKAIENSFSYKAMAVALEELSKEDIQTLLSIHNKLLASLRQTSFL
ncbi:MarR family winged helix-turn-helix transcriptional regulator [Ectobacillus funiculus]|uniref:MarR family winged helix-turn-helix transcriptional regulator n=1 Tax=Ectobacillus funiculus TaxID=137993 RepID=A0ABV5WL29_9BACI